jgi:galactoside O-acetyltransferase
MKLNMIAKIEKIIRFPLYCWVYSFITSFRLKSCGHNFRVSSPLVIKGGKSIVLGHHFSTLGIVYLFANDGGRLQIGNNCSINVNVQIGAASGNILIGNNVMIGPNVVIRASNHGMQKSALMQNQPHTYGIIEIGDDVWIGANCVFLDGTNVGKGCVIAASSVVRGDIPPFSICAGTPLKIIGTR